MGLMATGGTLPKGETKLSKVAPSTKSWPQAAHSPDKASVQRAAERLNEDPSLVQRRLKFKVHQKTGEVFVQVTNAQTGKVLATIPSEAVLDLQARFRSQSKDDVPPLLVDTAG